MSLKLYDDALLKKLTSWTQDTAVSLTGVNESTRLFSTIADSKNDKPIALPLIALSRPGGFSIKDKYKQPRSHTGATVAQNDKKSAKLNMIGITIPYQIDIYCRYQDEADEYIRNIVFNIINYPNVKIEIPYHDLGIFHDCSMRITSDVEDNSSVPERLITGQFTRYTIEFIIDDAYLFDVKVKDNVKITQITTDTMSRTGNVEESDTMIITE